MKNFAIILLMILSTGLLAGKVSATVLLPATNHGHFRGDGVHFANNLNYATGNDRAERDFNSFFAFDLSPLAGSLATGASLDIYLPATGYSSPDPSETLALYDVAGASLGSLVGSTGTITDLGIFADLGSGVTYGSTDVTAAMQDSIINIALNSDAVTAINNAIGGLFAIGGGLLSAPVSTVQEVIFVNTQNVLAERTVLRLDTVAVSAPSTALLCVAGLFSLCRSRRRDIA